MKREVVFVFAFILFLVFTSLIYADEQQQVQNAYSCVENRINQTGCSSLSFEEKVFSALATGKCMSELSKENLSNQCWPKSGCTIESTAQAILALNKRANTTKAENWLLSQNSTPPDIDWFLEIESSNTTSCIITYSDSSYTISIGDDKKISSNAGKYLTLSTPSNYWLEISPQLYNKEIQISCNQDFITTLLFMKKDSSTVHVSNEVIKTGRGTTITEQVNSLCFVQGGVCNYEGSLWATLVLYTLGYDVSNFMPYLVTMMDDTSNQKYIPESFLYALTGKFNTELLLKQNGLPYWEASGDKYYDTALALWPLYSSSTTEEDNSKTWLLGNQQKTGAYAGCWNNNLRDTAFILYSIWPKDLNNCPEISCEKASLTLDGGCSYSLLGCIPDDGCCNGGCTITNDNDCASGQNVCITNSDCTSENHNSDPYCSSDGNVYQDVYTYTCDNSVCNENINQELIDTCSSSQTCDAGVCAGNETTCGLLKSCPDGEHCTSAVSGVCIADTCEQTGCPNGETCNTGVCVGNACDSSNPCPNGETCNAGECYSTPCTDNYGCDNEQCVNGVCVPFECDANNPCANGNCTNGYCTVPQSLDCLTGGYFCTLQANCENNNGNILGDYSCAGSLDICCDTQPALGTCSDSAGDICTSEQECTGTTVDVSDNLSYGENCCVGGTCEAKSTTSCTDESGTCKDSCGSNEEEVSYTCDSGQTCCVAGTTPKPSHLWILIVLLLILIALAFIGIVFRDKLRVQWIKLKDKLGGKKEKKKFEMPLTSYPNPQGRILPRRILPPGQTQQQQSEFPVRRPIYPQSPPPSKPSASNVPAGKITTKKTKKSEEKPKNELDDVLKKLRDMGK